MEIQAIKERVREVIATQLSLEPAAVTDHATLENDLGADSLDAIEIVMAIEDEFAIEITDEEAERFTNSTVTGMADALAKHPDITKS